jgi:hypothetical protein
MSEKVSVYVLELKSPWKAPSFNVLCYKDKRYVSKSALGHAMAMDPMTLDKKETGHFIEDLTRIRDSRGNIVAFPTRVQSGIDLKNVAKIVSLLGDRFTSEEQKKMIDCLHFSKLRVSSSDAAGGGGELKVKVKVGNKKRQEEEEEEEILPQKKRYSPPPSSDLPDQMLNRMIELEKSIIAHSQLSGQVIYKNSDKFKEDCARWETEEREKARRKVHEEEIMPFIKERKEEVEKKVIIMFETTKAKRLAELDKEIEELRLKRIAEIKISPSDVFDEINKYLLK